MQKSTAPTFEEIKKKISHYCVYQDRCHYEVEQKLKEFDLIPEAYENIILYLIQHKFLDEERFTRSFIRGKFHQKKWGKNKIRKALQTKRVPIKLIESCFDEIDDIEYHTVFREVFDSKWNTLSEKNSFKKKGLLVRYMQQKGFESEIIYAQLQDVHNPD